jgi:hypothetical protein
MQAVQFIALCVGRGLDGAGDETVAKNVAKLSKRLNKESLQVLESKGTSPSQTSCTPNRMRSKSKLPLFKHLHLEGLRTCF